jgi:hypothetical protein
MRVKPRRAEAERQHAAGRLLRELADVADVGAEQLRAAGDVAIEQERLGEADRVVLRARPGLHETVRLSPRPRKFAVWNDSWPKKPSNSETPAPKVS